VTESGREREALCGELERVGPAAPTLCGGRSADEPGWAPRPPETYRDDTLWHAASTLGRLAYRRSPVGVVLRGPSGASWLVRSGPRPVTAHGEPGELVVHMCRRPRAHVALDGPASDVTAALAARPGTLFGGFAATRPGR
jgi:hypothetical protein